jgi:hypothetical protein
MIFLCWLSSWGIFSHNFPSNIYENYKKKYSKNFKINILKIIISKRFLFKEKNI